MLVQDGHEKLEPNLATPRKESRGFHDQLQGFGSGTVRKTVLAWIGTGSVKGKSGRPIKHSGSCFTWISLDGQALACE